MEQLNRKLKRLKKYSLGGKTMRKKIFKKVEKQKYGSRKTWLMI